MENQHSKVLDYNFLLKEDVQKSFADLHTCLLSGKHICIDNYSFYILLQRDEPDWKFFYRNLYGLNLVGDVFDGQGYYYLDFFDLDKGNLGDPSRNRALTEIQTITGLVLLDMYYQRYFDEKKIIHWSDIQKQIEDSEHREQYQRLLFRVVRDCYTAQEWQNAERQFRSAINRFDKLGWVCIIPSQGEEFVFEIKPAIYRMAKLYESELSDLDAFVDKLKNPEV